MIVNLYDPGKDADLRKEWIDAFKAVSNLNWRQIDRVTQWQEVFPLSVIRHSLVGDDPLYSVKAQWWERRAAAQLLHWKGLIDKQVELGRQHLADLISENRGHTRFLPSAEEGFRAWIESVADYTIKEFTYLPASPLTPKVFHPSTPARIINRETVGDFLAQWQHRQKQASKSIFDSGEQLSPGSVIATPLSINKPKKLGFESYIYERYRDRIMPFLISQYTGSGPGLYGLMLYALVDLNYIPLSTLNGNQTALHRALQLTFGEIGGRQGLNAAIHRLDSNSINEEDKRQINEHKERISNFLKQAMPN